MAVSACRAKVLTRVRVKRATVDPAEYPSTSFIDFDLTGSYKLTSYLEVFGAIENLFDTNPPFNPANYAGINYNPTYGQSGIVGRFFRGGVKLHF